METHQGNSLMTSVELDWDNTSWRVASVWSIICALLLACLLACLAHLCSHDDSPTHLLSVHREGDCLILPQSGLFLTLVGSSTSVSLNGSSQHNCSLSKGNWAEVAPPDRALMSR